MAKTQAKTQIDPDAFYVVAVPFVTGSDVGVSSYGKGRRLKGSDPIVSKMRDLLVLESEASSAALDACYSRHWNARMEAPIKVEHAFSQSTQILGSDDMVSESAKKAVAANPNLELVHDADGRIIGHRPIGGLAAQR